MDQALGIEWRTEQVRSDLRKEIWLPENGWLDTRAGFKTELPMLNSGPFSLYSHGIQEAERPQSVRIKSQT